MGLDESFSGAFVHRDDYRCLGRRLAPFSLKHALGLQVLGYGERGSGELTDALFLRAVDLCCARDDAEWRRSLLEGPRGWRLRMMNALLRRRPLREVAVFQTYHDDFLEAPEKLESKGQAVAAPGILTMVTLLVSMLGLSREEAWWMSPGEAVVMSGVFAQLKGSKSSWLTEKEKAVLRELGHEV